MSGDASGGGGEATVRRLLARARERLIAERREISPDAASRDTSSGPTPRETHLLLGNVLGLSEASLLIRDREPVPAEAVRRFEELLERRLAGEPAAHLLGRREFWGREFSVDPRVLVPRPETEHLVETVLELDLPSTARLLDIGVGSGVLAATLVLERPAWRALATDLSPAALAVARHNLERLDALDRVILLAGDLVAPLAVDTLGRLDLVVSNPPYVSPAERADLAPEVADHEPALALFSPDHPAGPGLAVVARLLEALHPLAPGTPVVLEIGHGQGPGVERLVEGSRGAWRLERMVQDLGGTPRVVVLRRARP